MLIRISLIVAVIGGLAVAGINFATLQGKIATTITQRDDFHKDRDKEAGLHASFEKKFKDTTATLEKTKGQLVAANQEKDQAVARANDEAKRAADVAENLKKTNQELGTTKDKLARWEGLGTIEQVKATIQSVKEVIADKENVIAENKILFTRANRLDAKLKELINPTPDGTPLPEGLIGKVLAVDPKFEFVVLDIGEREGAQENGQMLVNRNGKLIAKVKITESIQPDRCIANVMPGWKLDDIMEGDQVLTLK